MNPFRKTQPVIEMPEQPDYAESLRLWHEQTAVLEAELQALQPPADAYRITKDFAAGTFTVEKWTKAIMDQSWVRTYGVPMVDYRYVRQWYEPLKAGLPTHKAAESWLKAYLDPTTNRVGYDAQGNRLAVSA